ncbi:MAG: hypothetical protein Q9165_006089 [Trypethelium subeluteriae]
MDHQAPASTTGTSRPQSHHNSTSTLARFPLPSRTSTVPESTSSSTTTTPAPPIRKPHLSHLHHHSSQSQTQTQNSITTADKNKNKEKEKEKEQKSPSQEPSQPSHQKPAPRTSSHRHRHSTHSHRHGEQHHHHHSHRHHGFSVSASARDVVQSAGAQLQAPSWTELLRQRERHREKEKEKDGGGAGAGSVKEGLGVVGEEAGAGEKREGQDAAGGGRERWEALGLVRVEDVERERGRGKKRDEELRTTLNTLTALSHDATRRLDTTYYAILDKVSLLRSTIADLQQLSDATAHLRDGFDANSRSLQADLHAKIGEFTPGAQAQEEQIRKLEERLVRSREVTEGLTKRVDEARGRVRGWEDGEREWQARTTRRLRMLFGGLGAILVFLIALAAFHTVGPSTGKMAESVRDAEAELETDVAAIFSMLPADLEEIKSRVQEAILPENSTGTCSAVQTPDWVDEKFRVLDEL